MPWGREWQSTPGFLPVHWQRGLKGYKSMRSQRVRHDWATNTLLPLLNAEVKWSEVKWSESHSVVSDSLQPHGLYSPWNSLGQNTGVGSLSLLQGSPPPRDWTQVSHNAGGFFTSWATREAPLVWRAQVSCWTLLCCVSAFGRCEFLNSAFSFLSFLSLSLSLFFFSYEGFTLMVHILLIF